MIRAISLALVLVSASGASAVTTGEQFNKLALRMMAGSRLSDSAAPDNLKARVPVQVVREDEDVPLYRHSDVEPKPKPPPKTDKPTGQPTSQPTGQPSSRPSGQPTGNPTSSPTVVTFNKLTYTTETFYLAKYLSHNTSVNLYHDDVFNLAFRCSRYPSREGEVRLRVRNTHRYDIQCIIDSPDQSVNVVVLNSGETYDLLDFNYVPDGDDDNGNRRQGNGINAAIFCSDGSFLASYGETSIFQEDYYDSKRYYSNDCGYGGFIRIAVPNAVYAPNSLFGGFDNDDVGLFGKDVSLHHQKAGTANRFHALKESEDHSVFAGYAEVLFSVASGGAIGFVSALVAVFAILKVATFAHPHVECAADMEMSVSAKPAAQTQKSIEATWKKGNSIPGIEF